ncbi:tetratricopeptide repeat protein [Flavobacterium sp. JLP]|uniref:tetratricopeptide repeat protein n=1 Tax=unclassified Flavobacterium TaxID=196869 RepID=UPI0004934F8F|nr:MULTISPECIES: tetratricopeptide repeat protein [unclassified Flavobacterium]MBF4491764.1 tetratricopeptide repeat protein [Flavobacterium sp. MR2016-29]MBF4505790.1 tetratricopeptide repeat protein [Flavobacterium sp. JLP]
MKKKIKILSILLLITIGAFAQKDEIKEAQSNYDKGKSQEAAAILKKIEYQILNAPDDVKTDYFFLKGNVYKDLASKNIDAAANFTTAISSFQDVLLYENDSRIYRYAVKANLALKEMKSKLVDGAYNDYQGGKFKESADKSYEVYLFDKKDTLNLFNAATASLTGKDYVAAIKYYEELKKINYSGKGVVYYATNKKTKVEESFMSVSARESNVKAGLYEKPRTVSPPSKKPEILGNLAFSYLERNDFANAEKYYNEALQLNQNCIDCYINLAYVKIQMKKALVDQMAMLGNSPKEMKEYDILDAKKNEVLKSAIPILKQALTIEPKNEDAIKSLLGIYRSLDMKNEYNALKGGM